MNDYKYTLEPYSGMKSRFNCPNCEAKNTFTRYIDAETNQYLADDVGLCERLNNCAYHFTPKQYFERNGFSFDSLKYPVLPVHKTIKKEIKQVSFIPFDTLMQSLKCFDKNRFVYFLQIVFGERITEYLISRYYIGTSSHWNGATVFWQIDEANKVRTGKIIQYDKLRGKRVKENTPPVQWIHKNLDLKDFNLEQCYFGEHLLTIEPLKAVAIVESEKTAIIASVYYPHFIWLAIGSLTNLSFNKLEKLSHRQVTLFPDLKGYERWRAKAEPFKNVQVSDLLELNAPEQAKDKGYDLADFLLNYSYLEFVNPDVFPKELLGDYSRLYAKD